MFLRIVCSLAIGLGVGFLVWGGSSLTTDEAMNVLHLTRNFRISQPGEALGIGAGLLAFGLAPLILSSPITLLLRVGGIIAGGFGAGFLAWGIMSAIRHDIVQRSIGTVHFTTPGEILGWGCGLLVTAGAAITLSFFWNVSCCDPKARCNRGGDSVTMDEAC